MVNTNSVVAQVNLKTSICLCFRIFEIWNKKQTCVKENRTKQDENTDIDFVPILLRVMSHTQLNELKCLWFLMLLPHISGSQKISL